jgi:hypothetical protein
MFMGVQSVLERMSAYIVVMSLIIGKDLKNASHQYHSGGQETLELVEETFS